MTFNTRWYQLKVNSHIKKKKKKEITDHDSTSRHDNSYESNNDGVSEHDRFSDAITMKY